MVVSAERERLLCFELAAFLGRRQGQLREEQCRAGQGQVYERKLEQRPQQSRDARLGPMGEGVAERECVLHSFSWQPRVQATEGGLQEKPQLPGSQAGWGTMR